MKIDPIKKALGFEYTAKNSRIYKRKIVKRYVDTGIRHIDTGVSSKIHDGKKWSTAYSSLQEWNNAEQTDLVAKDISHRVYCKQSTGIADSETTICGWVTNENNIIIIEGYVNG